MAKKIANKNQKVEVLKVNDNDRMQLLLLSSEIRVHNAEHALARAEFENTVASLDKDGRIVAAIAKMTQATANQQLANQRYAVAVANIEKKLGMSLSGLAMNPETGVVTPISDAVPGKEIELAPGSDKPNR